MEDWILILVPLIVKVPLNLPLDVDVEILIMVKPLENSKELGQLIALSTPQLVVGRERLYHFAEFSHDVWENGNADEKAKSDEQPFAVAPRIVVTEPHCGKRCEWEVEVNKNLPKILIDVAV